MLPPEETYEKYYKTLSKYDSILTRDEIPLVDSMRGRTLVDICSPFVPRASKIFDLGCGSGILLNAFQEAGWTDLTGLDPAPGAPDQAKKLFGLTRVISGTADRAEDLVSMGEFDLVCLTGALEHLSELRENIQNLAASMHPSAKLLIEVPALERFPKEPSEPFGEFSLEHLQFFSATTLQRFLATFGYEPLSLDFIDLPTGYCDSLVGLFSRNSPCLLAPVNLDEPSIEDYIGQSTLKWQAATRRITETPASSIIIYGAGSHTARLLPWLEENDRIERFLAVLDNNPNLQGKYIGDLLIQSPTILARHPDATVLISSFRSQDAIADMLGAQFPNPILRLY